MTRRFQIKLAILVGSLMAALILTVVEPSPKGLNGEARAAPGTPAAKISAASYNLGQLRIVNLTLQKIHDSYVDPERIDSRRMLVAALDSVQRNVAEVLVESKAGDREVTIQVNDKSQTFSIADVDSPWKLHGKMKEIFRFIQANMNPSSDPADIEYAAANGLLSTLDPHSVLLDPEQAREMDVSTSGKFGGIGIEIGMRQGKLTVLRLISPTTPAAKAGLKSRDHIVKINGEATINLTLNEAMNRLRGDPHTRVVVTVERRGTAGALDVPIVRDEIHVPAVEAHMLKGNVGYLRIKSFSSRTREDMIESMNVLRRQGARGWVLDLRWNPGGLLDQAVKVSDLFVDSGTIVTTVGFAGKQRKEERAQRQGSETASPVVVLINSGSASASEIVAGALKNLGRAIVVGQTSFGKGSVQVLFDNDDGSKLKLTIAQYLTPGDVSIQSVGITPDIELVPVRIPGKLEGPRDIMRLRGVQHAMREADLDSHLTSQNARKGDKPAETLRYLYEPPASVLELEREYEEDAEASPEGGPTPELEPPPLDEFVEDSETRFARDLVAQAAASRRADQITKARALMPRRRADEETKITAALSRLGIDWSAGPKADSPKLSATFTTDKAGNKVAAGDVIAITGSVTNAGTSPAYRLQAHVKSDDYAFEDTEFVFGRVEPGATRTFTAFVKVPMSATTRVEQLTLQFEEANGARVDTQPLRVAIDGQPRPLFAYAYQLVDLDGNGDGLLQKGEKLGLHVTIKNQGDGKSHKTTAILRNASGDGVVVKKGRFELGEVKTGESKTVDFTFDVGEEFGEQELVLELSVFDTVLLESVKENVKIAVRSPAAAPQGAAGVVKVSQRGGVVVREGGAGDAPPIGNARAGALLRVTGKAGTWTRVEVEPGRPGFVPTTAVRPASGSPAAGAFEPVWQVTPPTIAITAPTLETGADRIKLQGQAQDDTHVEDVFVLVWNRDSKIEGKKVLYRSNRGGKDKSRMDFSGDIPLWPGSNMVTVIAREDDDVRTTQTLFIFRSDPKKAAAR